MRGGSAGTMDGIESASTWQSSPPPLPVDLESRRERRLALGFALLGLLAFGAGGLLDLAAHFLATPG